MVLDSRTDITKDAESRLLEAAWNGDHVAIERLLREGASPNVERDGLTPLHLASTNGSTGAANALIRAGATVDAEAWPDLAHWECLTAVLTKGPHDWVQKERLARGCPPRSARDRWWQMLSGRTRRVFIGGNECGALGCTPLHLACDGGHTELVSLLLAHGADPYMPVHLDNGLDGFWLWTPTTIARGQPPERPHLEALSVLESYMRKHPPSAESKNAQVRRDQRVPPI